VSDFDRTTPTLDEPTKPKTVGSRLADIGDRLARTFAVVERPSSYVSAEPTGEFTLPGEAEQPWERIAARFPVARDGYDRAAVDQHISELERELIEVRSRESTTTAVAEEISRIGEQTSTILMAAHEQAQEITRRAKAQADGCIADAASRAMAMTQQAERRLRALDGDTDTIWSERAQLIDDVRSLATALTRLAEESARRFPPEPDKPELPIVPVAEKPTISVSRLGGEHVAEPHDHEPEDG
jgi:DivIVA protein